MDRKEREALDRWITADPLDQPEHEPDEIEVDEHEPYELLEGGEDPLGEPDEPLREELVNLYREGALEQVLCPTCAFSKLFVQIGRHVVKCSFCDALFSGEDGVRYWIKESEALGFRPFEDMFEDTGLLWLINRVVFHPRGFAMTFWYENDGRVTGWKLDGDGSEPWYFNDPVENDRFRAVEALFNSLRPTPNIKET